MKVNQKALFEITKDAELMQRILSMPKIDLHRHLTGSIDAAIAVKVAAKYGIELPSYITSELEEILSGPRRVSSLNEYFSSWSILHRFFVSGEVIRDIISEVIRKAVEDNIIYLELRTGPHGFLGNEPYTFGEFVHTIATSILDAEAKFGITVRCILGIPRHVFGRIASQTRNKMFARIISTITPFYPNIFVGVDLNGDEAAATGEMFRFFFKIALEKGLGVTIHAGECGPASNVEYAIKELGASRIGHGLAASKDPKLLSTIAENKITMELCPTSNEILGLVSRTDELYYKKLEEYGIRLVVCSDNPARNKSYLSEELFKMARSFSLTETDLVKLTFSALVASFADEKTKKMIDLRLHRELRRS